MRRKKRVRVIEMPVNDPYIEKYIIKKGVPVDWPMPIQVPVEPMKVPVQQPNKYGAL